jgi:aspartate racemase
MSKHIGIVACSPEGAALCYQSICKEGAARIGHHKYPEVSLHNHSLGEYMEHIHNDKWEEVADLMLSSARKLKAAGADFIICPDNTIHQVLKEVESRSPLPWLHIANEVSKETSEGGYTTSAILGTKYLMTGPVYPNAFKQYGLKFIIPTQSVRDRIDRIIFNELVYGDIKRESKKYLLTQIRIMKSQGCDSVVLGCTELPLIVLQKDSRLPLLDSTRILARAALRHSLDS